MDRQRRGPKLHVSACHGIEPTDSREARRLTISVVSYNDDFI